MKARGNHKKILYAAHLLLLFVAYWCSITLFPHSHVINGRVYVHSHPYHDTEGRAPHSHTTQQIILIEHLMQVVMTAVTLVVYFTLLPRKIYFYQVLKPVSRQQTAIPCHSLRAPPTWC